MGDKMNRISSTVDKHVTERTHPHLDWKKRPIYVALPVELIMSDAFSELTSAEKEILCCLYSKKRYPKKNDRKRHKKEFDYWKPENGVMSFPYAAVIDFFHKPKGMNRAAPSESTFQRALEKFQTVGFISISHMGGNGQGDASKYRLEHNWRVWRKGDPPCFHKAGLSRNKGFCMPGCGVFNPTKYGKEN